MKLNNVAVIGLGYVGLPLAIAACDADYQVIGIDSNSEKIKNINSGNNIRGVLSVSLTWFEMVYTENVSASDLKISTEQIIIGSRTSIEITC